ncbi:MAG: hypothetical protein EA401_02900 [Planctomycetota bacterium]|nr:MAG: hypothetical protein EA401_02900 [Planctomycetota bacterium]
MVTTVAVLDIGKTNKKLCCYRRSADGPLALVETVTASFPAVEGDHGLQYEDTRSLWEWLAVELPALYRRHPFAALAITTHGATYALIDAQGGLAYPVIAYDSPISDEQQRHLDQGFYHLVGPLAKVQAETGSCDLPLLVNPAKSLYTLRERHPQALSAATSLLNYPQYWGFRLTGQRAAEATYTANHSFLFDIQQRTASSIAQALGVAHLLPKSLQRPWDQLGVLAPELQEAWSLPAIPVAVGIHDSNAALLPHLLGHGDQDFVLNSTGTWCVAMHRVSTPEYQEHELEQKIIFNIDCFGDIHKTSFLMAGQDYGLYHDLIGGVDPGYDPQRVARSIAHVGNAIMPGAFPSQFPGWHGGANEDDGTTRRHWSVEELRAGQGPTWWSDQDQAHDLLNVSLALQSQVALQRTGISEHTTICIEGGFSNNGTYVAMLAECFPQATVALTNIEEATSCGTALLALALAEGKDLKDYRDTVPIIMDPVSAPRFDGSAAYIEAYHRRLAEL